MEEETEEDDVDLGGNFKDWDYLVHDSWKQWQMMSLYFYYGAYLACYVGFVIPKESIRLWPEKQAFV